MKNNEELKKEIIKELKKTCEKINTIIEFLNNDDFINASLTSDFIAIDLKYNCNKIDYLI